MMGRSIVVAVMGILTLTLAVEDPPGSEKAARGQPLDEQFAEIEARVPGFAGFYRDPDGRITIRMADMREAAAALEAVVDLLGVEEVERSGEPRLVSGDYPFSQLASWKREMSSVHALPGVSLTDVDEAANRVRIGIEDEAAREAVVREVHRLGIPEEAVTIDLSGSIGYALHLQGEFRPVVGGIQIVFGCDPQAYYCLVCTDGFLTLRGGSRGFVTNSHCTNGQGSVDSTIYYQPEPFLKIIARESADPPFTTDTPCPTGRLCRVSDSAFAAREGNVKWKRGFIARPNSPTAAGALWLSSKSQRFKITRKGPAPMVGDLLNKVGRTTGWTQGLVMITCADVNVSGSLYTYFCQDIVDARVDGGDSGSPVFGILRGSRVALYGILWGGAAGGERFVFSRLASIEAELGPMKTCNPDAGC